MLVFGPADPRQLGLGVDHRLAFGIGEFAFRPDAQIAALSRLPCKLHELLGVLRRIEQMTQLLHLLAGHDRCGTLLDGIIPFSKGQLQGGGRRLSRSAWSS